VARVFTAGHNWHLFRFRFNIFISSSIILHFFTLHVHNYPLSLFILFFSFIFVLFRLFYLAVQSSLFTFSFSFSSLYFFCYSLSFQFYFFYFTLVIEFHVDNVPFFSSKSQTYLLDLSFFTYSFCLVSFFYLFLSLFTVCPVICFSYLSFFLFLSVSFKRVNCFSGLFTSKRHSNRFKLSPFHS
jgi:hypothetical protein